MLNTSLLGAMNSLLNQVWNDMVAVVVSQSVTDRLIAIRIGRQSELGVEDRPNDEEERVKRDEEGKRERTASRVNGAG